MMRKFFVSMVAVLSLSACVGGGTAPTPDPQDDNYRQGISAANYGIGNGCVACGAVGNMSADDAAFARQNAPRGGVGMGAAGGLRGGGYGGGGGMGGGGGRGR